MIKSRSVIGYFDVACVFTRKFKRNNFDEYMSGGGFVEYCGFSRGKLETSDMGTAGTVY